MVWLWWVAIGLPGRVGIAGPMPGPFLGRAGGLGSKLAMEEGLGKILDFCWGRGWGWEFSYPDREGEWCWEVAFLGRGSKFGSLVVAWN